MNTRVFNLIEQNYGRITNNHRIGNQQRARLTARQFGHFHLAKSLKIHYSQQLRHPPRDPRGLDPANA